MDRNRAILITATLVIVLLFFGYRERKRRETVAAQTVAVPTLDSPAKEHEKITRVIATLSKSDPRRMELLHRAAGLKRMALKEVNGETLLEVKTQIRHWCSGGDLDALAADLHFSDRKEVLLSIEPLDSSGEQRVFAHSLPGEAILSEFRGAFRLPSITAPRQMGLFVCRDGGHTGRCLGKPSTDVNKVFSELTRLGPSGMSLYHPPDRVYYFQYLLFDGKGSVEMFDSASVPAQVFDRTLPEYVSALSKGSELRKVTAAIEVAQERTSLLRSLPVDHGRSSVTIVLPVMDPSTCTTTADAR